MKWYVLDTEFDLLAAPVPLCWTKDARLAEVFDSRDAAEKWISDRALDGTVKVICVR